MSRKRKDIQKHWDSLRDLGCIICKAPEPTIHHCHGGSMRHLGVHKGMACKTSDWLVIPLAAELHSIGPNAIDGGMGVLTWETIFGRQVDLLDEVCQLTGVDVWGRAGVKR